MVGKYLESNEVHLPLILRISAKKLHQDAINRLKKFVTGKKIATVRLAFFYKM